MADIKSIALHNIIGQVAKTVLTIAFPIILVRLMKVAEYGEYQTILLVTHLFTTIFGLYFVHNLWYFFPISKDKSEKAALLSNNLIIMIGVAISFFLIGVAIKPFIINFLNIELYKDVYTIGLLFVSSTLIHQSVSNIFLLEGKTKFLLWYPTINNMVRVVFILISYLIFNSVYIIILTLFIWATLNTIFFIWYLSRNYHLNLLKLDTLLLKKQLRYIWPFSISSFIGTLGSRLDKLILAALFTPADFAIYRVGSFKLPFISSIYSSIGNTILTRISELSVLENGKKEAVALWQKLVIRQGFVTFPVVVFFIFAAKEVITLLFGVKYEESIIVFQVFLASFFVEMLGFGYLLRGFAKTTPMLYANIGKLIITVLVGYVLIYYFGFLGAALTYIIGYATDGFIQLFFTKRYMKMSFFELLPVKEIMIMAIVSTILIALAIIIKLLVIDYINIYFLLTILGILYFVLYTFIISKIKGFAFVQVYITQIILKLRAIK